jgi:uncharacterized membrane protein YdjX (TVP38/TMEM64 family)
MQRSTWFKLGLATLFVAGLVLFFALGGQRYFDFETIKASRTLLLEYRDKNYVAALLVAIAVFIASTTFSLPIATLLSLVIGLLFGKYVGTLVIAVAGTVGATLLFVAARYVFADFFRRRVAGSVGKFDALFRRNAFVYLAVLRVIPIVPFWLVNLVSAFTPITVRTYAAATLTGMVPISFIWASLGESLESIASPGEALSGSTLIALCVLGGLGLAAIFMRTYLLGTSEAEKEHQP